MGYLNHLMGYLNTLNPCIFTIHGVLFSVAMVTEKKSIMAEVVISSEISN